MKTGYSVRCPHCGGSIEIKVIIEGGSGGGEHDLPPGTVHQLPDGGWVIAGRGGCGGGGLPSPEPAIGGNGKPARS